MTSTDRRMALERAAGVRSYIQGEVLEIPDACLVLADAAWPLSDLAEQAAIEFGGTGFVSVPEPVDLVALMTQTCDLQETSTDARLCQVAPVVDRGERFAREAHRGRRPGWAALPWHSEGSIADLSRITTVERSVLIGATARGRPRTPAERVHFAETVSRHFTRIALPDTVCKVLAPFLQRIKDKHDRQSDEGECISRIAMLRIEATPDFDDPAPSLRLLVVLEAVDLPSLPMGVALDDTRIDQLLGLSNAAVARDALATSDPVLRREAWTALVELWIQDSATLADSVPGVDSIDVEVLSGDELTLTRLRNAPQLDLAYLTTRAA